MRPHLLPKSLLVTVLGGALLTGLGAPSAMAAAPASATAVAAMSDDAAEARFFEMNDLFWQSCAPDVSDSDGPALPPGDPIDPLPVDPYDPVRLDPTEQCVADRHARRVSKAFSGTDVTDHAALLTKLTGLKYPAARIHRVPDHLGEPRVRLDLRMGGDHVALQVTGTGLGVTTETFGASEGVSVTDVRLEPRPQPDEPTS
ncbi:hypothetical protein RM704_39625 [Streptomyces sp. DSM 3412]|uniref:Uncharacterized protein n=1 Tax=Streptomyces gottesmaniae TaxID=3075518 RepID=A0ABU2ZA64_9ACTN|nr:hypothetical protein [Streptomyces sp. DSM 3412]MDT0573487.1 hypothetical protein [Streptomyces sp. DSM 3412]